MKPKQIISDLEQINKLLKSKVLCAFDFDGVLADSTEVKTKAFYQLYKCHGESIAEGVVEHHRANGGMSRYEKFKFYHKFFLNRDISEEDLKQLCSDFSKLVMKKVINSPEIKGARKILYKLSLHNIKCIINSATPQEEIEEIIQKRELSNYFAGIYGSPISKTDNLKSAMLKHAIKPKEVVFFGDSKADLIAAECLNIHFIGVGKGIFGLLKKSNKSHYYIENFNKISLT